jgi:hypothetical protein
MRDWKPCVRDLLERLIAAGFTIAFTDNGEDYVDYNPVPDFDDVVGELTATDESTLGIHSADCMAELYIVLGNGPDEIVSDYGITTSSDGSRLDHVLQDFSSHWEGKDV